MSVKRWSGISFCNWETIWCSNVKGTLQIAFKQQFFKLDPAISKFTSSLIVIKKNPSSQEREK